MRKRLRMEGWTRGWTRSRTRIAAGSWRRRSGSASAPRARRTPSAPAPAGSVTKVPEPGDVGGDVINQELMIALGAGEELPPQGEGLHERRQPRRRHRLGAADPLARFLGRRASRPRTSGLDARALLAKLLVSQGQIDEATTVVTEGWRRRRARASSWRTCTRSRARSTRRARRSSTRRRIRAPPTRSAPRSRRTIARSRSTRRCRSG